MAKVGEDYIGSPEQRAFDILGASSLGVVSGPIMGIAALTLGVEMRDHHMLFRQERIGKDGEPFDILKLRTMPGQDHSGENEAGGSEHSEASLLAKFFRKSGADELPQSINVILGDLHLVGIRPQTPITMEQRYRADPVLYEDWFFWAILNPGMVGPGQGLAHVHQGTYTESSGLVNKVMRADVKYCEKASLKQDIACLAITPIPVVRGLYNMLRGTRAEKGIRVENKSSSI